MTAYGATLQGRRAAERNMSDRCVVKMPTGSTVDQSTGADVPTYTPVHGTTSAPARCKVQTFEAFEETPTAGEHEFTVQRYSVHFPVGSFVPAVGQVVEIVSAALDPNLTGREFRVVALLHKTAATAYRLAVKEIVA